MDSTAMIGFWTRMDQFVETHPYILIREGIAAYLAEHPADKPFLARAEWHLADSTENEDLLLAEWHTGQKDTIYIYGMLGGLTQEGLIRGPGITDTCRSMFLWLEERGHKVSRWAISDTLRNHVKDAQSLEALTDVVARYAPLNDGDSGLAR